ncbi:hypothetical protein K1719_039187 [Acacia pycnantha]|nr:hypothetical protein K1719_039187 [Acacia pycnantha]
MMKWALGVVLLGLLEVSFTLIPQKSSFSGRVLSVGMTKGIHSSETINLLKEHFNISSILQNLKGKRYNVSFIQDHG